MAKIIMSKLSIVCSFQQNPVEVH